MTLIYETRNLSAIAKLADHTKAAAMEWYNFCDKNNINILITETIRSEEQQKKDVEKGVSHTMQSYHLVGQALDFVPVIHAGAIDYHAYSNADIVKAIDYAKKCGFQWGGDWTSFVDKPHLQFEFEGYGTDTFGKWEPVPVTKEILPKDKLPKKSPDMYRLAKLIDTSNPELVKTYKSQGYFILDTPS